MELTVGTLIEVLEKIDQTRPEKRNTASSSSTICARRFEASHWREDDVSEVAWAAPFELEKYRLRKSPAA